MKNDAVVDTEGAGDTFTSAFINAFADGKSIADAVREAMAMASKSVGFLGSAVHSVWKSGKITSNFS